jgi:hypothetical protein
MEKAKQQNIGENKRNNILLKEQLKEITSQLEDIINREKEKKNNKLQESSDNKLDIQEFVNFQSKIDKYKKKIDNKEREIKSNYEYENIVKNENEKKSFTERLMNLQKENKILTEINKKLNQQLKEADGGDITAEKAVQMAEKLKNMKEEIKLYNDVSKQLVDTIRVQNEEIIVLDQYVKKLKANIEFAKKEQQQAMGDNNDKDLNIQIKEMKDAIKKLEVEKKEQEDNYNASIKKQKKEKGRVEQDVKILKIKIDHTKHENKINMLKLKEIKKIQDEAQKEQLRRQKEAKLKEQKKRNEQLKRKRFMEYQQKYFGGAALMVDDNGAKNYYNNTSMANTNNLENTNMITQSKANTKFSRYSNNAPFDIKFSPNSNSRSRALTQGVNDYEYNHLEPYNNDNNYDNNFDNENDEMNYRSEDIPNEEGKVINEIDNLKNDIMNVLNDNDMNIDIDVSKSLTSNKKKKIIKKVKKIKSEDGVQNDMSESDNNNNENENENIDTNNNNMNDNDNDNQINQNNQDVNNENSNDNDISEHLEGTDNNNDLNYENINNDIKVSGNRNPFVMSPFKNS